MSRATITTGKDTWVESQRPGQNHGGEWLLYVQGNITTKNAYVYVPSPAPRGAVITRATLTLVIRDPWGGAKQLRARRVTESFAMSRATYSNRPSVTSSGEFFEYVTPSPDKRGTRVELDVTHIVQAWANGSPNYGIEVSTPGGLTKFYSFNNSAWRPALVVEWEDRPKRPTGLTPSAAAVSVSHPTLSFEFSDVSGNRTLASVQVQVDPGKSTSAPAFDSGAVDVDSPELNLAETSYPGLGEGESTAWRVRAKDGAGLWSEWSSWATFSRVSKGTVSLLNPAPGDPTVSDVSPPILWEFTGQTQRAYRVLVSTPARPTRYLHDSGQVRSSETSYTIPSGVLKGAGPYRIKVRVYDTVDREATPGDALYAQATADVSVVTDGTVAPPSSVVATSAAETPEVTLSWSREDAPDRWTIVRDGEVIAADLLPEDAMIEPGSYSWTDRSLKPGHRYTYGVRAVVNGKQSPTAPAPEVSLPVRSGIYLVDPLDDLTVAIAGDDQGTWTEPEEAEVFTPLGAARPVRVVYAQRGKEGSLSGTLVDGFGGLTIEEQIERLYQIKSAPTRRLRLILADENFPVLIGNLTVAPSARSRTGQVLREVSFDFWQVGEFAFDTP